MLAELLRYFRLQAPPWARRLGLAHEHVAITFRRRRVHAAWAGHLAASRSAILDAAQRCRARQRVLVIGAGDCADVPVDELAHDFAQVILTDVVIGPELRRLVRRHRGRVHATFWDPTGVLPSLAESGARLGPAQIETLFAASDPGPPPEGEPDLVISANCISQLGVVPVDRLPAADADDTLTERCAAIAAHRHRAWLAARTGVRLLLGDRLRLDLAPDGRELRRELVPGMDDLRVPDSSWRWTIAPIPELSRDYHRVHEIGAWIDAPTR